MTYASFIPSSQLFMGAGPVTLHPRVSKALERPLISHLDKQFQRLFFETRELLQYVMRTSYPMTLPIQGSGSMAMEACLANLIEPGDHVVILSNGLYGQRMKEMATIYGARITMLTHPLGEALSTERLEEALKDEKDIKLICFVHGESSTGVVSDIKSIATIAEKYGALTLCDSAATLGGIPLYVEEWGLDAVYANPQKCLSCPPGLAPLSLSPRALHKIKCRKTPVQNWCLNLSAIYDLGYICPVKRFYPHTSPAHSFYALHEGLLMIYEEGIESVWTRHSMNTKALSQGLEILGMKHRVKNPLERLPLVNVLDIPEGLSGAELRQFIAHHHHIEISNGLGEWEDKSLRIGAMGQTCRSSNIILCLSALGKALNHFGKTANIDKAIHAAKKYAFYDPSCDAFFENSNTLHRAAVA